jgi:hypothetical protein
LKTGSSTILASKLVTLAAILYCTCNAQLNERAEFIADGHNNASIQIGTSWSSYSGYMEATGTGRILYANQGLADGNWRTNAKISLQQLNGSAASVVIAGVNHLVLDGGSYKISLEGTIWGTQGTIGDSRDYITPGNPFIVSLEKVGTTLTISINERVLARRTVSPNAFGTIGLRPHRNTMRVYDFYAIGNLTGFLPVPTAPRTILMPTLDLSGRWEQQTVLEAGTDTLYNGHPSTLRIPGTDTIYAVWTLGHGGTVYFLKRSLDNGATWSENLPTNDNWVRTYNCPTLHLLTAPDGRERLFVFAGSRAMFQAYSEDGGITWTRMQANGLNCIVAPMSILPVAGGKLRMWYHRGLNDTDASPLTLWQAESENGGLTWSNQRKIFSMIGADPCEPCVIRSPDGKRLLMFIRENQRFLNALYMTSEDDGVTWSRPQELPGDLTGDRHIARYAADGRLLIAFRDTAVSGTNSYGNLTLWVGSFDDVLGGTRGQYRVKVLNNLGGGIDSGYPGLEILADGSVLATSYVRYNSASEKPSIVSSRINLSETDAAAGINDEQSGPPVFLSQPVAREYLVGASVTLRITVAGTSPFYYQWYRNGAPIDGANSQNHLIPGINIEQAGDYHVVVTNEAGEAASLPATIKVWLPSSGTLSADRRLAFPGETITLTASANGTPPFRYTWLKDSQPIAITQSATMPLNNMQAINAGVYHVRVENFGSSTELGGLYVAVVGNESISIDKIPDTDRLSFSGRGLAPNRSYQVQVSTNLLIWEDTSRVIATDENGAFESEVAMAGTKRFWRLILK